jgi:SulP family sulfate permease
MAQSFTPKLLTAWREGYTPARLRADLMAGLTVAIVALPLSMALGIASGASRQGADHRHRGRFPDFRAGRQPGAGGGPTGAFAVVIAGVIARHGYDGLVMATLMAGIILVVAGYAGLGRLMRFVPMPVVTGFTAGIAVIIASGEVGDFLGLKAGHVPAEFLGKWGAYLHAVPTLSPAALAVGAGTLALILGLKRLNPRLPGYLIAIVAASLAVVIGHLPVETVGHRFPPCPPPCPRRTGLPSRWIRRARCCPRPSPSLFWRG